MREPPDAFKIDPITREIYIALPSPRASIRVTPPRVEQHDLDQTVDMMNSPSVYPQLGDPYPYTEQDAIDFLSKHKERCINIIMHEILPKLASEEQEETEFVLSGSPVMSIREVQENGLDVYIGYIKIQRNMYRCRGQGGEKEIEGGKLRETSWRPSHRLEYWM